MFRLSLAGLILSIVSLMPCFAWAQKYHGRFTFGGYGATERFADDTGGSTKNDFQVISTRLFFKVSEYNTSVLGGPWEFVTDLRDKHDFFDKLDRERFQLLDRNAFQVRQMSARYDKAGAALSTTLGRFPVLEAGAVNVDGVQAEYRVNPSFAASVFGGKNPKRNDQTYLQYNPDSNIKGVTTFYERRGGAWGTNFYLANSYVTEQEGSETDRSYLYHNLIYQWNESSRVITLLYLDFVPRTFIQTGSLLWQQQIDARYSNQLNVLGIDTIEYSRRSGVRETLQPSAYQEVSDKVSYLVDRRRKMEVGYSSGIRQTDSLTKNDLYAGWEENQVFGRNWDVFVKGGLRKNYQSNDIYSRLYLGYFSSKWEGSADFSYAVEKYSDGTGLHPLTVEASLSNYLAKELFSTISFTRATDERVTIYSVFFKVGYRFGNQQIAPIRDGASPRGQL